MRRLFGLVLATIVVLALFAPAAVAAASPTASSRDAAPILLAQGSSESGAEPGSLAPGPDPRGPNASDNPAAPVDYEKPVIWAGSMIFLALGLLGAAGFAAAYLFFVVRPRRSAAAGHR